MTRNNVRKLVNQVRFHPMYFDFEIDLLQASLDYPFKIFFGSKSKLTIEDEVPELIDYRKPTKWTNPITGKEENITVYNLRKNYFSKQVGILKFIDYSVDLEQISSSFLLSLCTSLKNFEDDFNNRPVGRGAILAIVENYRSRLSQLLANWNLTFFKSIKNRIRNENQVKVIVRDYIHKRIDASLLNLRLAKKFFDCYALVKNYDKGFLLLSRAFKQNKWAVDIFVNAYVKYYCEKPLMYHFLKPDELKFEDVKKWKWKSMYEWIETLDKLDSRNPYMKDILDYLGGFLSIEQIMEILETLAVNADKTNNFYESERFYENLLYIYDNVAKLELIEKHFSKNTLARNRSIGSPSRAAVNVAYRKYT